MTLHIIACFTAYVVIDTRDTLDVVAASVIQSLQITGAQDVWMTLDQSRSVFYFMKQTVLPKYRNINFEFVFCTEQGGKNEIIRNDLCYSLSCNFTALAVVDASSQ